MNDPARQAHWQNVYATRAATEVSWFQETPDISLDLVHAAGANPRSPIIDVGGGASRLVDALLGEGYADVTVLDISEQALAAAQSRLGGAAAKTTWIVEDVTTWRPQRTYDIW